METRAIKGGQIGINGEHYAGGQFLPTSPTTIKGEYAKNCVLRNSQRKYEIAPYTWEVAPTADSTSIYTLIAGTAAQWNVRNVSFKPFEPFLKTQKPEHATYLRSLIERWNNGERWV